MSRRHSQPEPALGFALRAAGVEVNYCHVHITEVRPCASCRRIFSLAKTQRGDQLRAERKAAHAAYIARGRKT